MSQTEQNVAAESKPQLNSESSCAGGGQEIDQLLTPAGMDESDYVHATSYENWISIQTDPKGLSRMSRKSMHFAALKKLLQDSLTKHNDSQSPSKTAGNVTGTPEISGVEKADVLIFIDKEKALKDGVKFRPKSGAVHSDDSVAEASEIEDEKTADGVDNTVVTRGIQGHLPLRYFKKVIDAKTKSLLWENTDLDEEAEQDYKAMNLLPRIDIHSHILPRDLEICKSFKESGYIFLEFLEKYDNQRANMMKTQRDGKEPVFFRQVRQNCFDVEKRIGEMNDTGIDVQVLSTVPVMFSYWTKDEGDAIALARHLNDDMVAAVKSHPDRFLALGHVPLQFPEASVAELERIAQLPGMRGIQIGSHVDLHHPEDATSTANMELSDPKLYPVWEACERLNLGILVHPWDMMGTAQVQKYWLPWLVGMPAETTRAVCHILFSGVIDRFPKLRLYFSHGGGSFPYTVGRIEHGFSCRPDLVAVDSKRNPMSYLGSFWVDSLVHEPRALEYVIEIMGEDRVLMGSDYPFPLGEWHPGQLIATHKNLSLNQKSKLLYKNACEFLDIKIEDFGIKLDDNGFKVDK